MPILQVATSHYPFELLKMDLNLPMGTTGTVGSTGLGLTLTGIGVVGPFTMTCPGEKVGTGSGQAGQRKSHGQQCEWDVLGWTPGPFGSRQWKPIKGHEDRKEGTGP